MKTSTRKVRRALFIFLLLYSVPLTLFVVLEKFLSVEVSFLMGMWSGGFVYCWFILSYAHLWRRRFLCLGLNGFLAFIALPLFFWSFPLLAFGIYYDVLSVLLFALFLMTLSGVILFWRGGEGEKGEIKVKPRTAHLLYAGVVALSAIVCAESFGKDWLTFFLVLFALSSLTFLLLVPEKRIQEGGGIGK
jgi:hypothetical protein